jgi:A/G-specific adenine glycosylase
MARAIEKKALKKFHREVFAHYDSAGRHTLPWRRTRDPYKILVSEIMLQQTQVHRVIPFYRAFLKRFPTVRALAGAPLRDVLHAWSGLGYNRRAKFLWEAAKAAGEAGGIPCEYAALRSLPGVGEYTAKAVRAFAFNEPEVLIETNIRAALIHAFFPRSKNVSDAQLRPILEALLELCKSDLHNRGPREWYAALMDWGSHVKKQYPNPSRRSKHHTRQSVFQGSVRQLRGALLRRLVDGPLAAKDLASFDAPQPHRLLDVLVAMKREGLVTETDGRWRIT